MPTKRQEVDVVRIDNKEIDGGIPIYDYFHAEMHKGRHFYYTETVTLASAADRELLITTPDSDRQLHFEFSITGKYITTIDFYEGSSLTGGTALTIFNNLRGSTLVSGATLTHTPAGTGDGTKIFTQAFGDGTNPLQAVGGAAQQDDEIILKKNTKYLLRVTSGTNSNRVNINLKWYEHTIDFGAP